MGGITVGKKQYQGEVYDEISSKALAGSLKGKVVLVIGSSRGLGKYIAQSCAEAGAKVGLTSRSEDELKATAKELEEQYKTKTSYTPCDMADVKQLEALIAKIEEDLGPIDVVVSTQLDLWLMHGLRAML